ncbi:Tim10/DDP family zinc finger protein (macronuclear) [Tetrahymena thermophila SB210]|uniref:Mitochondrial import inner membrane translocase subunit n=1 Tax=Tetrahymena thermophila (strain SB210) TaxID=312017 RepID=Q237C8_TETTS|nr:Tim10/DDP family zinc finger protein [Tetrahymena thermophila SB210]EAR92322.1 Tim10/DDP family zinc finger protein [Tetrahymena thermophila SB210]|eukprot:XP_001012567.1 Tim10/DDP family zinc finger protein [Tetrahymena thermophila SB210]
MSDLKDKAAQLLFSKISDIDTICYDKCVSTPQKKLNNNEEYCLKSCTIKLINALNFMHTLNENGGVDRIQPSKSNY